MSTDAPESNFRELFAAELQWRLDHDDPQAVKARTDAGRTERIFEVSAPGSAEAPRVISTQEDCVGLAFSGGGIRSATFNLGLLQALHSLKLLRHVDYLSTVSGGGYIGAWWSAWLARRDLYAGIDSIFPEPRPASLPRPITMAQSQESAAEPEEIRHLREFSNFLAPRIGFFETETWSAILAVLSAMLPALAVALSVVALALLAWLGTTLLMLVEPAPGFVLHGAGVGAWTSAILIAVVQLALELRWGSAKRAESVASWCWANAAVAAMGATVLGWLFVERTGWLTWRHHDSVSLETSFDLRVYGGNAFDFDPHIFHAPLAWMAGALGLLVLRIVILRLLRSEDWRAGIAAADRVLQRMIALSVVWFVGGALWLGGAYLHHLHWGATPAAGGAIASAGLFAWLRNWIATQLTPGKKGGLLDALKPLLPQVLAVVAVVLTAVGVAGALAGGFRSHDDNRFFAFAASSAAGVVLFAVVCFDPAKVSMHAFYRNRLARAYLGASNKDALGKPADDNRYVDLRRDDDLAMRDLLPQRNGEKRGPLHLICCAANDVGGDQLGNLARASRSAVLSPIGFQIHRHWRGWRRVHAPAERGRWAADFRRCWTRTASRPLLQRVGRLRKLGLQKLRNASSTNLNRLTLSSAITASAAAFNSNMGSISANLGTLVCFLMSALNLRLGLWLPHPQSSQRNLGWFPGHLFLLEMFGLTHCGVKFGKPIANYVHLSDGAHFENLGLYELVRRHCRYIIVSDCGADSTVAFDDFGNAARRIREDFGIEIDLDLSPLKPDPLTKLSRQHMVVGSIYYDSDHLDVGILLYVKPTLTGDEPGDIAQYRTRNEQFPHENTGDQFYDEAQWESYRRLGEHAIREALRCVEHQSSAQKKPLEAFEPREVFYGARQEWYQAPADLAERVVEAGQRISELEDRIHQMGLSDLVRQLYPEIEDVGRNPAGRAATRAAGTRAAIAAQLETHLPAILEIFRVMEEIWLSCHLETHHNHPINVGTLNLFHRWSYAPSSRLWWPFVRTLHGSGFQRFVEEHFALRDKTYPPSTGRLKQTRSWSKGLAHLHWQRSHASDPKPDGAKLLLFEYLMTFQLQDDGTGSLTAVEVQFGLAAIRLTADVARLVPDEFYIPPSLWGSGIGSIFIRELQVHLQDLRNAAGTAPLIRQLEVPLPEGLTQRRDRASRQERNDLIAFYKLAGFQEKPADDKLIWRPKVEDGSPLT